MANTAASELITRCLDNMSRSSVVTTRSGVDMQTMALGWLNKTLSAVSAKHAFREMKQLYQMTTVAGSKTYSYPSNYNDIIDMRIINGTSSIKLKRYIPYRFDREIAYPEGESTGVPSVYVDNGNTFDLFPIPDTAYPLMCRTVQTPTKITDVSSLIDYEPDKDELIIAGMTYRGFLYTQQYSDVAVWKSEYKDLLADAIDNDDSMPDWNPIARPFDSSRDSMVTGDYWKYPLYFGRK